MPAPKGHPQWGGIKKGGKHRATLEKEAWEERLRARIAQDADVFYDALAYSAQGVVHLVARDKDGTWKEVTDPQIMVKVLNSGETFYKLSARNPDVLALRDLFDRLCGKPALQKQTVDLNVSGSVDLLAKLDQGRQRAKELAAAKAVVERHKK